MPSKWICECGAEIRSEPYFEHQLRNEESDRRVAGSVTAELLRTFEHRVGSSFVKPIAKTDSCQTHHGGYVVSGKMAGVMNDGSK
jgi:hypothetical protein